MAHVSKLRRRVAVAAFVAAMLVVLFVPLDWWRPHCNIVGDGPTPYATGFPFPFSRPAGFSSMEFMVMPHVYALNVAVVATVFFAVAVCGLGLGLRGLVRTFVASAVGALVLMAATWLFFPVTHPVASIGDRHDPYLAYRPAFLVVGGANQACDP